MVGPDRSRTLRRRRQPPRPPALLRSERPRPPRLHQHRHRRRLRPAPATDARQQRCVSTSATASSSQTRSLRAALRVDNRVRELLRIDVYTVSSDGQVRDHHQRQQLREPENPQTAPVNSVTAVHSPWSPASASCWVGRLSIKYPVSDAPLVPRSFHETVHSDTIRDVSCLNGAALGSRTPDLRITSTPNPISPCSRSPSAHVEVFTVLRIGHRRTPLEATKEATTEIN